jgi:transcriptional regulator with XRE-family HTH domain
METILKQLRKLIDASEKTRYRISQETGIDQGQLSRMMHGKAGFSAEALEKLADCLGYKIVFEPKHRRKGK